MTAALVGFTDADPGLLAARELLKRVDRKFLLPRHLLEPLLHKLRDDFHLLRAAGEPAATYHTRYFDTVDRRMYDDHRRGRRPRFKVRLRHHVDRQLSFLEVKQKGHGSLTSKARLERPFGEQALDAECGRFIDQHCPVDSRLLRSCVTNQFRRITLIGRTVEERLTIDSDLAFGSDVRTEQLPGVVIVEIKQGRLSNNTPAVAALRSLRVREGAISKYCLATARLTPTRSNTFKPALRAVEHLSS